MIDFIKNIFRRKFLRRYSSKQPTGLVPLSEIRSVSIVLDAQENGVDDCKEAALTYFKSKGMKVNVYFLDLSKKGEDERQITSLNNTILRKDLNWYGRPALEIIEMISSDGADVLLSLVDGADVLLSLVDNVDFPIAALAGCSGAVFKIGRVQLPGRTFDLVVEDSPSHEFSPSDAFKEITRYLETIIQ